MYPGRVSVIDLVPLISSLVKRFDIEAYSDCLAKMFNDQTLQGSIFSVSTPKFESKYSLESS